MHNNYLCHIFTFFEITFNDELPAYYDISYCFSFFSFIETDFDINADWKDITVVYGALNQNDSVHTSESEAFLSKGNVMQMALEPDSIFIREISM